MVLFCSALVVFGWVLPERAAEMAIGGHQGGVDGGVEMKWIRWIFTDRE